LEGTEEALLKDCDAENDVYPGGGVAIVGEFDLPGCIFRIKFMGAVGFASARVKRPAVEVAEGGNGCCG